MRKTESFSRNSTVPHSKRVVFHFFLGQPPCPSSALQPHGQSPGTPVRSSLSWLTPEEVPGLPQRGSRVIRTYDVLNLSTEIFWCIYIYIYILFLCFCLFIFMFLHTHTHTCIYIYIYLHLYVYKYILYVYECVCVSFKRDFRLISGFPQVLRSRPTPKPSPVRGSRARTA